MGLAAVRDLRVARAPVTAADLVALETDVLAGFVLARAAAGLADGTIASDVMHLEQVRAWLGRPLWEMESPDADRYFGEVLRAAAKGTRLSRAQALKTYFLFLELRHKVEIHQMTGRVVECPIDEINRPRGRQQAKLRIPPTAGQVDHLFAGWREELATCRKFAPTARNYTACRLMSEVGLRVNEVCKLDLADVKWDLGRFGKLHIRHGKGARGSGPRERMVPLINNAGQTLRWFVEDGWGHFGDDHTRPGVPLLPSERKNSDATPARVGDETLRAALARAATTHLPDWPDVVTPHVLRHFCDLPALSGRHGPDRDPGHARSCLDRHDHELRARPRNPHRGCLDQRAATRRRSSEGALLVNTDLPAALRTHAHGRPACEAAVELMLAGRRWLRRGDYVDGFIRIYPGTAAGADLVAIDWAAAIGPAQTGQPPPSGDEQRILRLSASLVEGIPVDLRDTSTGMDQTNLELVAAAVLHAGGHHPTPERQDTP